MLHRARAQGSWANHEQRAWPTAAVTAQLRAMHTAAPPGQALRVSGERSRLQALLPRASGVGGAEPSDESAWLSVCRSHKRRSPVCFPHHRGDGPGRLLSAAAGRNWRVCVHVNCSGWRLSTWTPPADCMARWLPSFRLSLQGHAQKEMSLLTTVWLSPRRYLPSHVPGGREQESLVGNDRLPLVSQRVFIFQCLRRIQGPA